MYHTIRMIYQYDTIHTIRTYVSDDSWALTIYLYDTKLFVHDTIHIAYAVSYDTDNYVKDQIDTIERLETKLKYSI